MRSHSPSPSAGCLLLFLLHPAGAQVLWHPSVAAWVEGVSEDELRPAVEVLSGETEGTAGGVPFTLTTRSSSSGTSIDTVEQYLVEQLESYGLDAVTTQDFPGEAGAPPGRNVIGQIDGTTAPHEIVVVGAHMDDRPWTGRAPGADDDASGVSAVLYLARTFAGHPFQRTVRFALFGDEENAPWMCERIGSAGYAGACREAGEDIVAMIQVDSIAFNPPESDTAIVELNTRTPRDDPEGLDAAIYAVWSEAIGVYDISGIEPRNLAVSDNWSDHGSFWNEGYPAALLIEEEWDYWNPNWHTADDRVSTFDWPFYVQVTRTCVAALAHLALVEEVPVDTGTEDTGAKDTGSGETGRDETDSGAPDTAPTDTAQDDTSTEPKDGPCGCGTLPASPPLGLLLAAAALARRRRLP